MTSTRKFFIQPRKFFREYSQGDLTAKVLSLECFVPYRMLKFLPIMLLIIVTYYAQYYAHIIILNKPTNFYSFKKKRLNLFTLFYAYILLM